MTWTQQLDSLRWRSLEEADVGGVVIPLDVRHQATAAARQEHRAATVEIMSPFEIEKFILRRSHQLAVVDSAAAKTLGEMEVPRVPGWWALVAGIAAFGLGIALTGIGSDREINLLSLPLVGILIWNAVMILGSIVTEFYPRSSDSSLGKSWLTPFMNQLPNGGEKISPAVGAFHSMAKPLVMERAKSQARVWLHVAAAVLAMGICVGLYAKGWSREYRAVWESTLLDAPQAQQFFGALFAPASGAFTLPIPLDEVSKMQRGKEHLTEGVRALPWIHLYAGTLVLLVVLPRLVLAGATGMWGRRRVAKLWHGLGWPDQVRRRLREIEGGSEVMEVIVHGSNLNDVDQSRWRTAVQARLGGLAGVRFSQVESGEEDDFAKAWNPMSSRVAILFPFAATPEEEVHTRLVGEIRQRLLGRFVDGQLTLFLDAQGVRGRWDAAKLQSRSGLWTTMLEREVDEMIVLGMSEAVNPLRVPVSEAR